MIKYSLIPFVMVLLAGCDQSMRPNYSNIAHAGGGYDGRTYTNSIEAMQDNYNKGFKLFEIDLIWTNDNHLVCLHDWDRTPKWLLDYHGEKPLSLKEFNKLSTQNKRFSPCNIDQLNQFLMQHHDAFIVTDIKHNNLKGLQLIQDQIKSASYRIIPQIYQPKEYLPTLQMGFENIIWTLYAFPGDNQQVMIELKSMNLFAVTMPKNRAIQGLGKQLKKQQITTYVHTINDEKEVSSFINDYGIDWIYTDFYQPLH